jgi:hypothetical protein
VARLAVVVALITGVVGLVAVVGADARWLAALGGVIVRRGTVPTGVPFAAAPTQHWANTLVLAELAFDALEQALGDRGLVLAQLIAVALALSVLACDARAGGADSFGTASALALVSLGALASLGVARVQLFSLVAFALLLALLRAQQRRPSRGIYLALPLLALWSNLHGAALAGLVVLWAHLALSRFARDRVGAIAVAVAAPVAICLTPAGVRTVDYYYGLVTNVAAQRGVGLWAPLGSSPLDLLLIAATILLLIRCRRQRPPLWEIVVVVVLAALTVKASRDGVWLLFVLVAPAARSSRVKRQWHGLLPIGAAVAVALLAFDLARPLKQPGASAALVRRAVALARGTPILADAIGAEQVALAGGRIWAGNPLDAFSHRVQGSYLDWVAGAPDGRVALANPQVNVVLVSRGSSAQSLTSDDLGFVEVAADRRATIYERRAAVKPLRGGGRAHQQPVDGSEQSVRSRGEVSSSPSFVKSLVRSPPVWASRYSPGLASADRNAVALSPGLEW